jgi:type IV pilus assembly protein PilP
MMKPSLAALSFAVLLSGCSTRAPEPPPRPAAAQLAEVPSGLEKKAPLTELAVPEVAYTYNPVGKHDPFRITTGIPCCAPTPVCEGPLCGYSLEELKLTGVISGMANPVAVIESPQGKAFQIYRGSTLGRNGGVVKQVLRDSIVVAELSRDGQGQPYEQQTVLRIQPDPPVTLGE